MHFIFTKYINTKRSRPLYIYTQNHSELAFFFFKPQLYKENTKESAKKLKGAWKQMFAESRTDFEVTAERLIYFWQYLQCSYLHLF